MSITAFSTLAAVRSKLPYDPASAFVPVALVGKSPLVLVVSNDVPAHSVDEFLAHVKKQAAGKLNYASPGIGSVHHLTMELFQQETGVSMTHVPYKATSGVLNDRLRAKSRPVSWYCRQRHRWSRPARCACWPRCRIAG